MVMLSTLLLVMPFAWSPHPFHILGVYAGRQINKVVLAIDFQMLKTHILHLVSMLTIWIHDWIFDIFHSGSNKYTGTLIWLFHQETLFPLWLNAPTIHCIGGTRPALFLCFVKRLPWYPQFFLHFQSKFFSEHHALWLPLPSDNCSSQSHGSVAVAPLNESSLVSPREHKTNGCNEAEPTILKPTVNTCFHFLSSRCTTMKLDSVIECLFSLLCLLGGIPHLWRKYDCLLLSSW